MLTRSCSSEISRCTDEVNPWKFGAEREVTPRKQFAVNVVAQRGQDTARGRFGPLR